VLSRPRHRQRDPASGCGRAAEFQLRHASTNVAEGPISENQEGSSLFFKVKERTIANCWGTMEIPDKNTLLLLPNEILATARGRLAGGSLTANAFQVGLFCLLLSAFLYISGLPSRVTADIIPLAQHALNFAGLHEPILARRLTLPIVAHLLHLSNRGIIVIPILCNFLTLVILYYELALAMTEILAFLSVMLLSLTTMTIIGNTWLGMPDPISNLMGVACMASKSPTLIAVYSVIGLQSDERFALMIPFILLWHIKDCANFIIRPLEDG
jgi:hypothetical protein